MSVGIQPTTVMQAAPWVAKELDVNWPKDRVEVLETINDIRNLIYNKYQDFKLFDNVFHCINVTSFPNQCGSTCPDRDCYQAITLPPDVAGVEAAWEYDRPLLLRSRWREAHVGIDSPNLSHVEITQMAEQFATERDLQHFSRLKAYAERDEDCGKIMMVEVMTDEGKHVKLQFDLKANTWVFAQPFAAKILSVVLPPDLVGSVTLAQEDGYELSIYAPSEKVPLYRRFRVVASRCPQTILIQGTKKFQPVHFDHDIVEIGDKLILQAAARYFKFTQKTTDTKSLNRAEYDLRDMNTLINGLISRDRGHAVQDGTPLRGPRMPRRATLPGYTRR